MQGQWQRSEAGTLTWVLEKKRMAKLDGRSMKDKRLLCEGTGPEGTRLPYKVVRRMWEFSLREFEVKHNFSLKGLPEIKENTSGPM